MAQVHVIGAGLAGLAAAVHLSRAGHDVAVYEATDHAGGRCRSFFEPTLDRLIDNGNHLLLGANRATFAYLGEIGSQGGLVAPPRAIFPFMDLRSGERWIVRPGRGPIPWWLFAPRRRIPGTRLREYVSLLKVMTAGPERTIGDCLDTRTPLYERFWEPFVVAVLNTPARQGSAQLMGRVLRMTLARGEAASRPYMAKEGLSSALVDPAVRLLAAKGASIRFNNRCREIVIADGTVRRLVMTGSEATLAPDDIVILAVPPAVAAELVPGLRAPLESCAIVNAHFRLPAPCTLPEGSPLLGLVGGTAQWLFVRGDVASVTVSAADALADEPADSIARRIWPEVRDALELGNAPLGAWRIIKEKRATFAQTPSALARRPGPVTPWRNLLLAGDWTATGLPATIEGAIRSGRRAARHVLHRVL